LIQTIHLLPDFILLQIHSLSTDAISELTLNQIFILCSIAETTQITKVYFPEINHLKQVLLQKLTQTHENITHNTHESACPENHYNYLKLTKQRKLLYKDELLKKP
jgi:heme oxygenase